MSWIKNKIESFLIGRVLNKAILYLDGKKTVIGAINLLLWVFIYAVPALFPEYSFLTVYATQIRDALAAGGVVLDNSLFNTGVTFTVVGLIDKVRKLYKEYKDGSK